MKSQTARNLNSKYSRFRAPTSASELLERTFRNHGLAKKIKLNEVFQYWPELIGSEYSQVTKPEKITRGRILIIKVLDSTWAQELTLQKNEILNRFRAHPNGRAFEDIRFVVSGPLDFPNRPKY